MKIEEVAAAKERGQRAAHLAKSLAAAADDVQQLRDVVHGGEPASYALHSVYIGANAVDKFGEELASEACAALLPVLERHHKRLADALEAL